MDKTLVAISFVANLLSVPKWTLRYQPEKLGLTLYHSKGGQRRFDLAEVREVAARLRQVRMEEIMKLNQI